MNVVWVVTSGTYSDYCIQGIFSIKEKAKAYCDSLKGQWGDVNYDRYPIDDWEPERTWWLVSLWDDTMACHRSARLDYPPDTTLNVFSRTTRGEMLASASYGGRPGNEDDRAYWEGFVQAPTKERAIKIAAEKVAQAKAQLAGMG